jgi:hypothetical protein
MVKLVRLVIAAAPLLGGCAGVTYVQTGHVRAPRPDGAPLKVLIERAPPCPYDEIGVIRLEAGSLEQGLPQVIDKARAVGADAILVTQTATLPMALPDSQSRGMAIGNELITATAVTLRCPVGVTVVSR